MRMDYFSKQIEEAIPDCKADVTGDGSKFEALVISDSFEGQMTIKRHKAVYAVLNEHITSGAIHALTIRTYTKAEWEAQQAKDNAG
ncbi:BolA/IbaG family iron-sulfur metabolism protein [Granulosicoccaceae sp. 1_MG-2023]|nr:BolA/IbaG family iron-sulfur metabolism protein [Granulosicoccaceae sp. 1_MG-2023]